MVEPPRDRAVATLLLPEARDAAIAQLSTAFAHDVLSIDEFERRTAAAYRARSPGELDSLLADLPAPGSPRGAPALVSQPMAPRIAAAFANVERAGVLVVPAQLEIRAIFGNVELDLSEARFGLGVTEVSIRALFGNVEIRLPPGAQVENHGRATVGSFTSQHGSGSAGHNVRVLVTGRAVFANVELTTD